MIPKKMKEEQNQPKDTSKMMKIGIGVGITVLAITGVMYLMNKQVKANERIG
ncbi:hypothetical protein [Aquimarina pacifica]|uniref:hypothetical protein n=1 Tax=Aquimarina pacifica TaxID=1296415 RepID=UPI0004B5E442|nr:hypothetical protein [Aquimarina pacifica]